MKDLIYELAREFSSASHGSSSFDNDTAFVMGENDQQYVPLSYITKKHSDIKSVEDLQTRGLVYSSVDYVDSEGFAGWYKNQFGKKLTLKNAHLTGILIFPDRELVLSTVKQVSAAFELLRTHYIINNGKNLPVQLAEWYSKAIFGLRQIRSSSQRGFDFFSPENKRIEVMVDWNDRSSPKGAKLKKSLVELSDCCIIVYITKNLLIRDLIYLDSSFILRKFADKGHTIFLKDSSVSEYFFSVSGKHYDKIIGVDALEKFCSPAFYQKYLLNKNR
ncbi:MAG: hypothetical protein QE271_11070 [Bacteriovoracaceae bacterium]|nr:hypothetical protein [Bacteriovoracaceae bacterium]